MMQITKWEVRTVFRENTPSARAVVWNIVHRTEKALLLSTAGGTIWLPTWRIREIDARFAEDKDDDRHLADLIELMRSHSDVQLVHNVRIHKDWEGALSVADADCLVKSNHPPQEYDLIALREEGGTCYRDPAGKWVVDARFSVPVWQLQNDGTWGGNRCWWVSHGHLYVEAWRGLTLFPPTIWPGLEKAEKQLTNALRKARSPKRERRPVQVLEGCTVEWPRWVKDTINGGSVVCTQHKEEGCRVEVFGKDYRIQLPCGRVMTRPKDQGDERLKITPAPAPAETEASR